MNIYVSRDGQTFGPYTVEQAGQFLQAGQLLGTDFALYEGESEWKTLGALLGMTQEVLAQPSVTPDVQPQPPQALQSNTSKVVRKSNSAVGKQVRKKVYFRELFLRLLFLA